MQQNSKVFRGHSKGTVDIMRSHMLTPEELSDVAPQMSMTTLCRSRMIPAAECIFELAPPEAQSTSVFLLTPYVVMIKTLTGQD